MKKYRIGILETHPIQYKVPWFRLLHQHPDIDLTVFYCMVPDARQQGAGFGVEFKWDLPLLEGYNYHVLENKAKESGLYHFSGCDTPEILEWIGGKHGVDGATEEKDPSYKKSWDAFIVNGWVVKSCLQALYGCRRYGIPCIVRGESNAFRRRPWWIRQVHRLLLSQYSAFLAIGKSNKQFYIDNGVAEEKIFYAPYGIENERFSRQATEMEPERGRLRANWGIGEGTPTFLFCAKFEEKKRPMDLLKAVELAAPRLLELNQDIHILMVGDGDLRQQCEEYVRQKELPVTFTGFLNQSEIIAAYVAADCLVLPSDYGETWGLVVNEAMACGRPAVVSDRVGCHPDLINPGHTGDVYPFGDYEALARKLAAYASQPEKLLAMVEEARRVVANHSVANIVEGCVSAIKYVSSRK